MGPQILGIWGLFYCPQTEPHVHKTEKGEAHEVQARVHLARRLRAGSQPALEDEDRLVRGDTHPRAAPAVELRRQLDAPGGRLELGLLPAAGRALPGPCAQERVPRDVRGAAPG